MGRRGPRGRNWHPDERRLMYRMVRDGRSREDVNEALRRHQSSSGLSEREVPEGSYEMMRKTYLPHLVDDAALDEMARKPRPMGDL